MNKSNDFAIILALKDAQRLQDVLTLCTNTVEGREELLKAALVITASLDRAFAELEQA